MGCSLFNIDGVSKRVVYSESVSKMQQNGIEKSNFSNRQFSVLCNPTKFWWAVAHLILMEFQKELYILNQESIFYNMVVKFLTLMMLQFGLNLHRIT